MEPENSLKENEMSPHTQGENKKRVNKNDVKSVLTTEQNNDVNISNPVEKDDDIALENSTKKASTPEKTFPWETDFYNSLSKDELYDAAKYFVEKEDVFKIQDVINSIKSNFYKIYRSELDIALKKYKKINETSEGFQFIDLIEQQFKLAIKDYRNKKAEYNRNLEAEKSINLQKKFKVVESIKNLLNSEESMNKTFHEFKELQKQWFEIGMVPQSEIKILWDTYNHHVENFYDYLKINRQLRDLDYKKNLESKTKICEEAESLIENPNIIQAFKKLQTLHQRWREIGPVFPKNREEIWMRFKEITHLINKKHQDYFLDIKKEQNENLAKKTALCEKVEAIIENELPRISDWKKATNEVIFLQKDWRKIGFTPKKYNTKIYQRFRTACDNFFDKKREFNKKIRKELKDNFIQKKAIYEKAISLKDADDWEKTRTEFIELQKQWKEIGPIPYKYANKLWNDFREVCNYFFERRNIVKKATNEEQLKNLELKNKLISNMNAFEIKNDMQENLKEVSKFQNEFNLIGLVPFNDKNKIKKKFLNALNNLFDKFNIDEFTREIYRYKHKISTLKNQNSTKYIYQERQKLNNRLTQLKNDIVLWENNIGFFNNTSAEGKKLVAEYQKRIDRGNSKIKILLKKINIIDSHLH